MFRDEFKADLERAKGAEQLVCDVLGNIYLTANFTNVGDIPEYYYKGDIKAFDISGKVVFIEVKNDSRIADTGKVLCEEEVYYKDSDYYGKGNMYNDSDYYCVVSEKERTIYVFDFKKLKEIYKKYGEYKIIPHASQDTYCYLVELCWCSKHQALIKKIKY